MYVYLDDIYVCIRRRHMYIYLDLKMNSLKYNNTFLQTGLHIIGFTSSFSYSALHWQNSLFVQVPNVHEWLHFGIHFPRPACSYPALQTHLSGFKHCPFLHSLQIGLHTSICDSLCLYPGKHLHKFDAWHFPLMQGTTQIVRHLNFSERDSAKSWGHSHLFRPTHLPLMQSWVHWVSQTRVENSLNLFLERK